ncbi:hypothetical protein AAFF_G00072550 [Aldrovandia affinis]|uniref:Uncharacterized protein n=1 Tax=Aldrovandia affinis TaxID=143900 RepID=A0AAD7WD59_9TELE|nr:hypothetical protein AAFF_G00072550 [Aldrovandia affinis]
MTQGSLLSQLAGSQQRLSHHRSLCGALHRRRRDASVWCESAAARLRCQTLAEVDQNEATESRATPVCPEGACLDAARTLEEPAVETHFLFFSPSSLHPPTPLTSRPWWHAPLPHPLQPACVGMVLAVRTGSCGDGWAPGVEAGGQNTSVGQLRTERDGSRPRCEAPMCPTGKSPCFVDKRAETLSGMRSQ